MKNRASLICDVCGIEYTLPQSTYKQKSIKNHIHSFCSRKCYLYFHKEKTTVNICKMCNIEYATPLNKNKVFCSKECQLKYYIYHPSNNPNWRNGSSYTPYCNRFNKKLKEQIRIRDGRICQLCFKTEIDICRRLSIHHIHYDKENCEPDLISLCNSCNSIVNGTRDYYENLFINNLKERGLLLYQIEKNI